MKLLVTTWARKIRVAFEFYSVEDPDLQLCLVGEATVGRTAERMKLLHCLNDRGIYLVHLDSLY